MIPDEAVEAALAEWPRWPRPVEEVRRMLTAAAPHLMAQAWQEGMEAMYASTSSEWPPIPEQNPYKQ